MEYLVPWDPAREEQTTSEVSEEEEELDGRSQGSAPMDLESSPETSQAIVPRTAEESDPEEPSSPEWSETPDGGTDYDDKA
ncbi:uncharacterized protein J3R85_006459 [Psidium guajava]|nr:uncharacterized protein J3R85_006459 [Psidium guajava]